MGLYMELQKVSIALKRGQGQNNTGVEGIGLDREVDLRGKGQWE